MLGPECREMTRACQQAFAGFTTALRLMHQVLTLVANWPALPGTSDFMRPTTIEEGGILGIRHQCRCWVSPGKPVACPQIHYLRQMTNSFVPTVSRSSTAVMGTSAPPV